jgi:hypothetical protein
MPLDDFAQRIAKLQAFDFGKELETIVTDNVDAIADLQRDQMLEGRGVDGAFLRPFYSEDPYFKKPGAALRYARWKQKITPNPQRPLDVPNLIITGVFHESLTANVEGDLVEIETSAAFGDDVFDKFPKAQGLDEDKRLLFAETITMPAIKQALLEKADIKVK